jgi:hypothetical protein
MSYGTIKTFVKPNTRITPKVPVDYEYIDILSWNPHQSKYYELSPYYLKTDGLEESKNSGGVLFENFCKRFTR